MIPPVKLGGWPFYAAPRAVEIAQLDQLLSQRGMDAVGDNAIVGEVSVEPDGAYAAAWALTGSALLTHSNIETESGGRLRLGDNDHATLLAAGTRTVAVSMLEMFQGNARVSTGVTQASGGTFVVDAASGGIRSSLLTNSGGVVTEFPLVRPQDGAVLDSLSIRYYLPALPTGVPSTMANLSLFKIARSNGAKTLIAGASIPTPGSAFAYFAAGALQTLTVASVGETVDLATYRYGIQFTETGTGAGPTGNVSMFPVYLQIEFGYTTIADERPLQ